MRRSLSRIGPDGSNVAIERDIAIETPVALEFNGIGYAVLMATPADLHDLATGFSLSERLVDRAEDILDIDEHRMSEGIVVRVTLAANVADRVLDRVRHRASDSSCGLCGIENLEQAVRPLPSIRTKWRGNDSAIFRALAELDSAQPLNHATRAVHGAALCSEQGEVRLVREDVGRHNAFDKLIGAMLRTHVSWEGGFALLTSRCSYELVEKAVLSGCPMLATISAPTSLAMDHAAAAGLPLRVLARPDAVLAMAT
ncbi:formate dehydrogenase accessory sulfurtransferase FdhD [Sphingomonas bacterium]|uniref:formate dehydrogenase accessory sulfurtransferase FdhD n=1 Tax=Sphingomonas bacterium TaxID=1895847 RepID=UPI00260E2691|nr:formate dehydrogenase accessory sulfurtransferase FdhD [Sphingomonas bacterium]MDB5678513.1 formate dehydrogenase [Sphingomonas bacterium]